MAFRKGHGAPKNRPKQSKKKENTGEIAYWKDGKNKFWFGSEQNRA